MSVYTYSEARQRLASLLDQAASGRKVLIRRKDGLVFSLSPESLPSSPLDVPSVRADITTKSIVAVVRAGRERSSVRSR